MPDSRKICREIKAAFPVIRKSVRKTFDNRPPSSVRYGSPQIPQIKNFSPKKTRLQFNQRRANPDSGKRCFNGYV